jgi:hypothetical protein
MCNHCSRGSALRYTVILEREEDGGYVASVPALPGCVSQGDNIEAGDPVPAEAAREFVNVEGV